MAGDERTVWGIHAGQTGDAEHLFLTSSVVALGWHQIRDLSKLAADREALKMAAAKAYPEKKPGAFPAIAGQLFRFLYELKSQDIIAYPSRRTREIHLAEVVGPYRYEPSLNETYPNVRDVHWVKVVPRGNFTQGALYEIGSAMSFFQIKTYADEFRFAFEGKQAVVSLEQDETISQVSEDIEQATGDFILKSLARELKGYALQEFVAHLLQAMGYHIRPLRVGADAGIDVIAHRDELGVESPIIRVQVKSTEGSVGDPEVSSLYGKVLGDREFGLFITLGTFTAPAQNFARGKSNLRLIEGEELVKLILEHYDQLNSYYKSILPLKRVYVPDSASSAATE